MTLYKTDCILSLSLFYLSQNHALKWCIFLSQDQDGIHSFFSSHQYCNNSLMFCVLCFINDLTTATSCLISIWRKRMTSLTSTGHSFSKCTVYFKQKYKKTKHQIFTILAWQCSLSLVILPIWCFRWGRQGISSSEVWHDHMLNVYSINNLPVTQLAT